MAEKVSNPFIAGFLYELEKEGQGEAALEAAGELGSRALPYTPYIAGAAGAVALPFAAVAAGRKLKLPGFKKSAPAAARAAAPAAAAVPKAPGRVGGALKMLGVGALGYLAGKHLG